MLVMSDGRRGGETGERGGFVYYALGRSRYFVQGSEWDAANRPLFVIWLPGSFVMKTGL